MAPLPNELDYLLGQFVTLFGPAFVRNQAGQPRLLEGCLRLIKRRPGKAERCRRLADRVPVFLDATQHLVLDLNQVVGVEELAVVKELVVDSVRVWIETGLLT